MMRPIKLARKLAQLLAFAATLATGVSAETAIHVYGPGGPVPAMQEAANSGAAKQQWTEQKDIDAWLIWNIWQVANPELAEVVKMDEPFRIHRDAGVVLTRKGTATPLAKEFTEFLLSPAGSRIFAKWGWDTRQ